MSTPSKRLDSISRPSTPGSKTPKPSLKFKPKVVARKSKEERDSKNTVHTPGVNRISQGGSTRGRGGIGRGGSKINKKFQNTTIVSSGPLSEGTISLGGTVGSQNRRTGGSGRSGGGNALLERLKSQHGKKIAKKEPNGQVGSFMNGSDNDDDDGNMGLGDDGNSLSINMSREYNWDEADIGLFPVRADRTQHYEYGEEPHPDTTIKTEFHRATSLLNSEPTTREGSTIPEIKNETDTSELLLVPDSNTEADTLDTFQVTQESRRLQEDYDSISHFLKNVKISQPEKDFKGDSEDFEGDINIKTEENAPTESKPSPTKPNFFFLQLPCLLPEFENSTAKSPAKEEAIKVLPNSKKQSKLEEEKLPNGVIGKLCLHKSGKVTMKVGKVVFDVTRGGSSSFVQDIVAIHADEQQCYHLGGISEKIIATPKII